MFFVSCFLSISNVELKNAETQAITRKEALFYAFPSTNHNERRLFVFLFFPLFAACNQDGGHMSPGVVISPKKGGHAVVDSKAGAGTGKGGDKGLTAPDLLKWVEEPAGEGLPDRLHFIDLNPSSTRSTLSKHCKGKH